MFMLKQSKTGKQKTHVSLCILPQLHTKKEFEEVPSDPAERIAHKNKLMNKLETLAGVSVYVSFIYYNICY